MAAMPMREGLRPILLLLLLLLLIVLIQLSHLILLFDAAAKKVRIYIDHHDFRLLLGFFACFCLCLYLLVYMWVQIWSPMIYYDKFRQSAMSPPALCAQPITAQHSRGRLHTRLILT